MKIVDNIIIDFNYGHVLDASILECFIEPDDVILFPYYLSNGHDDFIEERSVIKCKESFDGKSVGKEILWYKPLNHFELIQILENESITYWCLILPKGESDIKKFKYCLHIYEHGIFDGEERRSLYVEKERNIGSFRSKVVPKILSLKIDAIFDFDE